MEIHFRIVRINVRIVFALMDVWNVEITSVQSRHATIPGQERAAKTTAMVRALSIKIALEQILISQINLFFNLSLCFTLMKAHFP